MAMQVLVNYSNVDKSDSLESHVRTQIDSQLGRFAGRLTRIEAHISDENAHKSGPTDKRCTLEARPAGMNPIAVESRAADFYAAVTEAAGKLSRALNTRFERHTA